MPLKEATMTTQEKPTRELHGLSLVIDGARMPVTPGAVRRAIRGYQERTGELVTWTGGVARIGAELVGRILAIERASSVRELGVAIHRAA
jgi:hypothetical protein